jgi:hypothetical protein
MPLSLLNHSALALFAQRTRISARSTRFCAIWVCISPSSSPTWAHFYFSLNLSSRHKSQPQLKQSHRAGCRRAHPSRA